MKLASLLMVLPLSLTLVNPASALITAKYREDYSRTEFTLCKDSTYQNCEVIHADLPEISLKYYSPEDNALYLKDWDSQCDRYMNTGKTLCMRLSDREFYDPFQ